MAAPDLSNSYESESVDALLPRSLTTPVLGTRTGPGGIGRALWAVSWIPFVALALLLSLAVRVWITDGAWPARNAPDPKDLGLHNTATVIAILASFPAAVGVPLLALVGRRFSDRRISLLPLAVGFIGFVTLFIVLRADVAGLGDWIGD